MDADKNAETLSEQWALITKVRVARNKPGSIECSMCGRRSDKNELYMRLGSQWACRACQPFVTDEELAARNNGAKIRKADKEGVEGDGPKIGLLIFLILSMFAIVAISDAITNPNSSIYSPQWVLICLGVPTIILILREMKSRNDS